jgi:tripartite-type tricarboxylate transporter receptor subunit TctC
MKLLFSPLSTKTTFKLKVFAWARLLCAGLAAFLATFSMANVAFSAEPEWPVKPVTIIIPFATGGTTDIIGREVGQKLSEALKQPVLIDNRPGAGGNLAAGLASKAAPDGYTLLLATVAHAMSPGLYKSLSYNFMQDFQPIGMVATTPNILIVNPKLPVKTLPELITYIKANPNSVNFGSAGSGSTEHLSGELFKSMANLQMTHIPYKGGAPMMTDLIAGQIQMAIETSPSATPHIQSGKVRALALTGTGRSSVFPDLPTVSEAGVKGYEVTTWYALMAPKGLNPNVEAHLATELSKVLKSPDLLKQFGDQGVTAGNMKSAQLAEFIKSETFKWAKVAKDSGATVD